MGVINLRESTVNGQIRINAASLYPKDSSRQTHYFFPYTGTLVSSSDSKSSSSNGFTIPIASLWASDTGFSVVGCGNKLGVRHSLIAGSASISSTSGSFTVSYPSNACGGQTRYSISLTAGSGVREEDILTIVGAMGSYSDNGTTTTRTVVYRIDSESGYYPSKLYYMIYTDDIIAIA